jgi:predicted TIM-barrel fold metal-dependent hydrolase
VADGAIALRLVPIRFGAPANDKIYFPLYTKCCELEIPVTITCGIPGPLVPGEIQRPIYFDELCYLMPELTIVSTHGGEPWTDELVKLLFKWPNLYHMISAFTPKWYPKALIEFMNSRGANKVMFATDYPLISWERAIPQLAEVPLKAEVWPKFLRENALRVFRFG